MGIFKDFPDKKIISVRELIIITADSHFARMHWNIRLRDIPQQKNIQMNMAMEIEPYQSSWGYDDLDVEIGTAF